MVQPVKPRVTTWRMCIACYITMAADTHSVFVILIAFQQQQWFRESASMFRLYVHCLVHYVTQHDNATSRSSKKTKKMKNL
jgi:hypothetical protein